MAITLQDVRDRLNTSINEYLNRNESPPKHLLENNHYLKEGTSGGNNGNGASQSEVQTAVTNAIQNAGDIDTLIQGVSNLDSKGATRNTTLNSVNTSINTLNSRVGASNSAAAISNAANTGLISLVKRFISIYLADRNRVSLTISSVGNNTIINPPIAGNRIVITGLLIQSTSAESTTLLLKGGASNTIMRLRTVGDGTGFSEEFRSDNAIKLSDNKSFVIDLSAANPHLINVSYYIENTSSALPV